MEHGLYRGRSKTAVRVFAVAAAALAGWHIFAQFLWIAPPSQLRAVVPGNALERYEIPLFGQSWSVFAPDPINGDYHFLVRAIVPDGTKTTVTNWIDATVAEHSLGLHNLLPPRAANLAVEQASRYKTAYDRLNPGQRKAVGYGYYLGSTWNARYAQSITVLGGKNDASTAATRTFLAEALHTDSYATQAAKAIWGSKVTYVQFQIYRQNIIPFADRDKAGAVRPPKQIAATGWRGLHEYAGQSSGDFAAVFAPLAAEGRR
ncbi:hypothetical protein AS850_06085 [Frondihabitans sp. 762G35]|uniref:DUF5819 family protein n=1 Tax=Frondihabitans sp. 762G35 TaxID=1446794 RepID=UPI000D2136E1|nr:DUF5819 family protein [Frondihabitans sp. 762G35]ARC56641.1 hypothetical protein AS850_06085 [Frondihabitans sp. 762G35]